VVASEVVSFLNYIILTHGQNRDRWI